MKAVKSVKIKSNDLKRTFSNERAEEDPNSPGRNVRDLPKPPREVQIGIQLADQS
jgi:hypothetical protein